VKQYFKVALLLIVPVSILLISFNMSYAKSAPESKSVIYSKIGASKSGDQQEFEGFIVYPSNFKVGGPESQAPGILLVHNWMGLTDETKYQAQRYADLGYVVFAADIYGKGIHPKDANEAGVLATKYKTDRKLLRERLNIAYSRLLSEKGVQINNTAVIGYCFGGTSAIELARSGAPLLGVLSFHGGLDSPTPADGKNIKAKIIAFHGALDPYVGEADVKAFEKELQTYKVDYQLIKYAGTVHSFTEKAAGNDITKGAAYNESSDKRSYIAAQAFLKEIFTAK
jgi:dienelactone hydrolase